MHNQKVQNAGLAQLCFQHASNRINSFQNVLLKHVRKVQEERSCSPDCAYRHRRGLPWEEHQVCSDNDNDDDNDDDDYDDDDDDNDDVRYNEEDIREWFR